MSILVLYFISLILLQSNKPLEAEEILQEALQLNPELFDTRLRYGNLLYNTGRPEEAVFHYKKVGYMRDLKNIINRLLTYC